MKLTKTFWTSAIFLICTLLVDPMAAHAKLLTPAGRLKKLSMQLRGQFPEPSEYADLKSAVAQGTAETFFAVTTDEYLGDKKHIRRLIYRIQELFQFEPFKDGSAANYESLSTPSYDTNSDPFDGLVRHIVQDNLSWDNLLTSKKVYVSDYNARDTREFYSAVFRSDDLKSEGQDRVYQIAPNDFRFAGALTTPRFKLRNFSTITNANRRRAAAVFRTFLCDPMKPAVKIEGSELVGLVNLAFDNQNAGEAGADIHQRKGLAQTESQHGTDPHCAACHDKLNPMGEAMWGIGFKLAPTPIPGRLFYRRKNGPPVDIAGRGIGEIANAVVKQREYAECQVKTFWRWYIGEDVPVEDKVGELVTKFDESGRKPKEFIRYLVSRPEFYNTEAAFPAQSFFAAKIVPILNKCNQCHLGTQQDLIALVTSPDNLLRQTWISKISLKLDANNEGKKRVMPPSGAGWDLSAEEQSNIFQWLNSKGLDPSMGGSK